MAVIKTQIGRNVMVQFVCWNCQKSIRKIYPSNVDSDNCPYCKAKNALLSEEQIAKRDAAAGEELKKQTEELLKRMEQMEEKTDAEPEV